MAEREKQELWYQGKAFQFPHLGGGETVADFHGPRAAEEANDWFEARIGDGPFDSAYVYERQGSRETMVAHWAQGYDADPAEEWQGDDDDYSENEFDLAMGECSMMPDGYCGQAGSEHCDFDCPFNSPSDLDQED